MENEQNCLKRVNSKYYLSNYQLGLLLLVFFYSAAIITTKASDETRFYSQGVKTKAKIRKAKD
jgi:hypothetical protein